MKKIITLFFIVSFLTNIFAQSENIYFDTDQYEIRSEEKSKLLAVEEKYKLGNYKILLVGHCDEAGSDIYNLELSKKRVNEVKEYFMQQQILEKDIQIDFQGEMQANQVAQKYRKVEIFLVLKSDEKKKEIVPEIGLISDEEIMEADGFVIAEGAVEEIPEDVEVFNPDMHLGKVESYEDFMDNLKPKVQIFKFMYEETNVITGSEGTQILIPENAFVFENGTSPRHQINLYLTEYYTKKEFVGARLNTMNNDNLLESAGMIHVEAKWLNTPLELAEGKELEILFPKTEGDFSIYYGKRDGEGVMNWEKGEDNIRREAEVSSRRNRPNRKTGMEMIYLTDSNNHIDSLFMGTGADRKKAKKLWNEQKLQRTFLQAKQLGFINCDDLIKGAGVKEVDYAISVDNEDVNAISAFLLFENINSVLELKQESANVFKLSGQMPLGAKVQLIITGMDQNEVLYIFENKFRVKERETLKVNLEKSSYVALEKLLAQLLK